MKLSPNSAQWRERSRRLSDCRVLENVTPIGASRRSDGADSINRPAVLSAPTPATPAPEVPKRKSKVRLYVLGAVGLVVLLIIISSIANAGGRSPSSATTTHTSAPAPTSSPQPATAETVPNAVRQPWDTATKALTSAGLKYSMVDGLAQNRFVILGSDWVVTAQSVASGTSVSKGTSVALTALKWTDPGAPPDPRPTAKAPTHTVMYSVWGNGSDSTVITYNDPSGSGENIEQASNAPIPWSMSFNYTPGLLNSFSVSAQDDNGTSITCMITVDGVVKSQETSTGQYAIADCNI